MTAPEPPAAGAGVPLPPPSADDGARTEASDLLPCPNPWCHPSSELPPTLRWYNHSAVVECASCGLEGPPCSMWVEDDDGEFVGTVDAEANAITAWNTRLAAPATPAARGEGDITEQAQRLLRRQVGDGEKGVSVSWGGNPEIPAHAAIEAIKVALASPALPPVGDATEAAVALANKLWNQWYDRANRDDPKNTLRELIAAIRALPATPPVQPEPRDPDAHADAYLAEYVMSTEGADYEPTDFERELIADAIHGWISEYWMTGQPETRDRGAMDVASEGSEHPEADRAYWNHELRAFDRTFKKLAALATPGLPAAEQEGGDRE